MTINESIYMMLSVSDLSKVSPLLMGNPGCGKTTSVEFFAKANNMKMVLLRGSQSSPEEILGYEVNDGEERLRGDVKIKKASKICPDWYDELLENDLNGIRTLLFLDEITTASSFVQAALLQVVFGREIHNGYKIPDSTFIVAAGNYASNLSSDFNLIPPLMNRFCIFNVEISSDDIKAFMSRYNDRQNVVSKMQMFDATYSTEVESIDKSFVDKTKRLIEKNLCEYVQSLIAQGKYNPNATEMSDIYSDQSTGSKLLGFLTPRTLGYYTSNSIYTYLKYGLFGIESTAFKEMTLGLVGISLSNSSDSRSGVRKKEMLADNFIQVVYKAAQQLDKNRVNSIASTEQKLSSIVTKLDSDGKLIDIKVLPSSDLISLRKVIESATNDRDMRKVQSPIDPKIILKCSDAIISSARNALSEDREKLKMIANSRYDSSIEVDKSSIDINKINGNIVNYNDAIKAYKSLKDFISIKEFNYESELVNKITKDDKEVLTKNRARIDQIKKNLRDIIGVSMSELVTTESL